MFCPGALFYRVYIRCLLFLLSRELRYVIIERIGVIELSPSLNVVLKFLWYLFSRLVIWGAAAGLVLLAFFMAMDYMNASVLTKDGFNVRAEVVIKGSDPTTLAKVFSKSFLENDEMLKSRVYQDFKISDFDYSADTEFVFVFPWQNAVTLRLTEKVTNITGQPLSGSELEADAKPPEWQNAVYDVQIVRYEESWRIVSMKLIEVLPAPTPRPAETEPAAADVSPAVTPVVSTASAQ